MVNAAARRVDPNAGELYHLLLQLSRQTDHPLTTNEVRDAAKKKFTNGPKYDHCDQYLQVLCECQFLLSSIILNVNLMLFFLWYHS
jgi:hypothetical protein